MSENSPQKRLQHQQQQEQTQQTQQQQERTFETPEEMLRYDAAQTPPPGKIAERLKDSMANEPSPTRPWWKRILGK